MHITVTVNNKKDARVWELLSFYLIKLMGTLKLSFTKAVEHACSKN